jgi:hypothetical protein
MRRESRGIRGRAGVLKRVFTSPRYVLVAAAAAAVYYLLFFYLTDLGPGGLPFATAPVPLVYALIASSAVLVALSAYAVVESLRPISGGIEGTVSVCTASFGCMIAGCGCYAPAVSGILYFAGLGAVQVSGVIALLGNYQAWLMALLIIINVAFIYYQTGRTAGSGKPAKRG